MTSLRERLVQYIKTHGQVHFRDIEKYAEENGYKAYTAVRRLQEVRDPKDLDHYDPEIGTVEENGTIKFYVYKPSVTQNLPRREEKRSEKDFAASQFLADWGASGKLRHKQDECITSPTLF